VRETRGIVTKYRSFEVSAAHCRVNLTEGCADGIITVSGVISSVHWTLLRDRDYKLAIEAATVAGYNDSLPLPFVTIPSLSYS